MSGDERPAFGDLLRDYRKLARLTQEALADTPVQPPADPVALLEGYLAHLQGRGFLRRAREIATGS